MNTYKLYLYNSTSYSRVFWSRFFLFCLLFLCGVRKSLSRFAESLSPVFFLDFFFLTISLLSSDIVTQVYYF